MKAKIMLINPPTTGNQSSGSDNYFPLGLLSLATVLKNSNIDVVIVDINNNYYMKDFNEDILHEYIKDNLCKFIKQYMPDIIGIGCIFSGAFRSLKIIAERIKHMFSDTPIAIGGMHPTIFAKDILRKYSYIDYVVIGEGETSFLELVEYITNNKKQSLSSIDGIAFRCNERIILKPKTRFVSNLDTLPFVDYSILNVGEYKMDTSNWYSPEKIKVGQPFSIISSRSCPQQCTFCSMHLVHGPMFRPRSADNVLDEMEYLYNDYNVRYFQFMDDNMTLDKTRTLEICNGILKRNMSIQFDTPNGLAINRLDQEVIDAMVDAGMVRVCIAIESGSEYLRNRVMRKGLRTEKIYEIVEACAKHSHLFIKGFFIIGMPEETYETLEETYEMIKRLPLDNFTLSFATPYPGTELFNYCAKHNMLPYKAEDYVDIEYLQPWSDMPHFKPHKLTVEDLLSFQKKGYDYLKEKRMASNLPHNFPVRS